VCSAKTSVGAGACVGGAVWSRAQALHSNVSQPLRWLWPYRYDERVTGRAMPIEDNDRTTTGWLHYFTRRVQQRTYLLDIGPCTAGGDRASRSRSCARAPAHGSRRRNHRRNTVSHSSPPSRGQRPSPASLMANSGGPSGRCRTSLLSLVHLDSSPTFLLFSPSFDFSSPTPPPLPLARSLSLTPLDLRESGYGANWDGSFVVLVPISPTLSPAAAFSSPI
jgi:hypothetical protein